MICSKSSSYSCIKHETQSFFQAGRKLLWGGHFLFILYT
jgi:hypothetical protein